MLRYSGAKGSLHSLHLGDKLSLFTYTLPFAKLPTT